MKGWHKDNFRHSLAAKGYNVKLSNSNHRLSMEGVVAPHSYPGNTPVPAEPAAPGFKNVAWDAAKDSANYMAKENSGVSHPNALSEGIKSSWSNWFGKPTKEKVVGGVADNVPDDKFLADELMMGAQVEMEHTNDPEIAKEIAKDHIMETSKPFEEKYDSEYYLKLKQMEEELK